MSTWQRNEIQVSILLGIKVTGHFGFEFPFTYLNWMGLWSAECWQLNQHQHVFAGQSLCAKTFKSCVGSGDSSTWDKPECSTALYIVERELACFASLCHHPLHWTRLLTLALSIGPCQCSYIFVSCWPSALRSICRWRESKNIVCSNSYLEYVCSRFSQAHPLDPELPSAIKYFFKFNSYQIERFFEAMGLHRTLDLNSNPMDSTHSRIISNERWTVW